jgi:hypothetical protein
MSFFQCPFSSYPERDRLDTATTDIVLASYNMWFSSPIDLTKPETAMWSEGDSITWNGDSFNILMSDTERRALVGNVNSHASHPDKPASMAIWDALGDFPNTTFQSYSNRFGAGRGKISQNYLRDDGSVMTLRSLESQDTRLRPLPYHSAAVATQRYWYLPPAE